MPLSLDNDSQAETVVLMLTEDLNMGKDTHKFRFAGMMGSIRKHIKIMANFITFVRVVCSVALLFCPTFSTPFYILYITAGFTDMIDGTIARETCTVSEFGSKFDTVADFILVVVCLIKLIPVLDIESWMFISIGIIVIIKMINIISGFVVQKKLVTVHSVMNKMTGGLLFILPLTVRIINFRYSAAIVCAIAFFAAIQEGHYIRTRMSGKMTKALE